MKQEDLQSLMHEFALFDGVLLFHGYKRYMRDYELIVEIHVGPAKQGTYSYLFKYCVEANISTSLPSRIYRKSLDERLIMYETGKDLDGYVWGVNWSLLYPGWELVSPSQKATEWSERIGLDFHEVSLQSNAYTMTLIFSELVVAKVSGEFSSSINSMFIPLSPKKPQDTDS